MVENSSKFFHTTTIVWYWKKRYQKNDIRKTIPIQLWNILWYRPKFVHLTGLELFFFFSNCPCTLCPAGLPNFVWAFTPSHSGLCRSFSLNCSLCCGCCAPAQDDDADVGMLAASSGDPCAQHMLFLLWSSQQELPTHFHTLIPQSIPALQGFSLSLFLALFFPLPLSFVFCMSPPPPLLHLTLVTAVLHIHRFSDLSSVPDHLVLHLFQVRPSIAPLTPLFFFGYSSCTQLTLCFPLCSKLWPLASSPTPSCACFLRRGMTRFCNWWRLCAFDPSSNPFFLLVNSVFRPHVLSPCSWFNFLSDARCPEF